MAEKELKARIQHKHDVEANWIKATNFIPKQAELVIYDPDATYTYSRVKVGDGIRTINELPFTDEIKANKNEVSQVQIITWGVDD